MIYAVTGASGKLGRLAAEELLRSVPTEDVVLVTRTPQAVADFSARGVQVRQADFEQPDTLLRAFDGVERLLIVSVLSMTGENDDPHRHAVAAARACEVGHVTFTSMPNIDDERHPIGWPAREYLRGEQTLRASGVPWTILRNGPYMELNVIERTPALSGAGRLLTNAGEGRSAFISRQDCAAVAVKVLTSDGQEGNIYDIWGAESFTWREVARLLSEMTGTEIEFVSVDDAEFSELTRASGMTPPLVEALTGLGVATREGYFDGPADTFHTLMGRYPQTLREVLERHRGELQSAG